LAFYKKSDYFKCQVFIILILFAAVSLFAAGRARGGDAADSKELKKSFQPGDNLALIRAKIAANGYVFTVADNWVMKLPQKQRERMRYRRRPVLPEMDRRRMSTKADLGPIESYLDHSLPHKFDLRNVDSKRSYIGPIRQQGSCGACYAFGACAAAESAYNLAVGSYNQNCVDFSEAFIIFCLNSLYDDLNGCNGSGYNYEELDSLVNEGVCYENLLPYKPGNRKCTIGLDVPTVRFTSWYRLPCNNIKAIKTAIYNFGAVDVSVATTSAFDAYNSGIYEDTKTGCEDPSSGVCYFAATDHVVNLVGWNDNNGKGYWILRNSWGEDWGEAGYMRIKYNAAHVTCAACYLVFTPTKPAQPDVEPASVAPWLKFLLED